MYEDGIFQVVEYDRMLDNNEPEKSYKETIEYLSKAVAETFFIIDKPAEKKP